MAAKEKEFERVLKALANRRRLAVISYLKNKKEASVGEIAEHIKLSIKATSKHVALLAAAGVLEKEQNSRFMIVCLVDPIPEIVRHIVKML